MKAMKAMKAKRVSKIAKGRFAKSLVFRGSKEKTTSGLNRGALVKNKRGKVVSKRQSAAGKRNYKAIEAWTKAAKAARKALNLTGFVAMNGKGQGKALYAKTKEIYAKAKPA